MSTTLKIDNLNILTERIIGCAIEVHRNLGPGLLESAYQQCLIYELKINDLSFQSEVNIPINYKGMELDCGFRADLIIEEEIIVELKAVESILSIHEAQVLTYLKLTGKKLGLILNFNTNLLINGIKRLILEKYTSNINYR